MSHLSYQETGYAEVPADLKNVAPVAAELRSYCRHRGIDETIWPQLEVGFCEALNNAIEHGCKEDDSKTVLVQWSWKGDWLTIQIDDPGGLECLSRPVSLPDDPLDESGRGQFLMETVMDEITHQPCALGHRVVMKKRLHAANALLDRMEEMYAQLQAITAEFNFATARISAIEGVVKDLSLEATADQIVRKSLDRLREFCPELQSEVWIGQKGGLFCQYADDARRAANEIAVGKTSSVLAKTFLEQRSRLLRRTSEIDPADPICLPNSAALLIPIEFQERPIGALALIVPASSARLLEEELDPIAKVFARLLGVALSSAAAFPQQEGNERSLAQLEIASEIQRSLLPSRFPNNQHCRVAGTCLTAMEVGGDYIDAIEIRDFGLLIVIADVMGKGVPAALLATIFRTAIHSRLNLAETPGWLLSKINKQIHDELGHLNMFITAQAAFYTYDKRKLKLASAGHCPALLLPSGSEEPIQLTAEGLPLGIDPNDIYEERIIDMNTEDRVLFMTDGMFEVENQNGDMLGIDGFSRQLPAIWSNGFESVTERAFTVIENYIQGQPPSDDKTLMALEIL